MTKKNVSIVDWKVTNRGRRVILLLETRSSHNNRSVTKKKFQPQGLSLLTYPVLKLRCVLIFRYLLILDSWKLKHTSPSTRICFTWGSLDGVRSGERAVNVGCIQVHHARRHKVSGRLHEQIQTAALHKPDKNNECIWRYIKTQKRYLKSTKRSREVMRKVESASWSQEEI